MPIKHSLKKTQESGDADLCDPCADNKGLPEQSAASIWNVEAIQKLEQMYERLGVPEKWRS